MFAASRTVYFALRHGGQDGCFALRQQTNIARLVVAARRRRPGEPLNASGQHHRHFGDALQLLGAGIAEQQTTRARQCGLGVAVDDCEAVAVVTRACEAICTLADSPRTLQWNQNGLHDGANAG